MLHFNQFLQKWFSQRPPKIFSKNTDAVQCVHHVIQKEHVLHIKMTIEFSVLHVLGKNMYRNDDENFHTTCTGKEYLLYDYKK